MVLNACATCLVKIKTTFNQPSLVNYKYVKSNIWDYQNNIRSKTSDSKSFKYKSLIPRNDSFGIFSSCSGKWRGCDILAAGVPNYPVPWPRLVNSLQ